MKTKPLLLQQLEENPPKVLITPAVCDISGFIFPQQITPLNKKKKESLRINAEEEIVSELFANNLINDDVLSFKRTDFESIVEYLLQRNMTNFPGIAFFKAVNAQFKIDAQDVDDFIDKIAEMSRHFFLAFRESWKAIKACEFVKACKSYELGQLFTSIDQSSRNIMGKLLEHWIEYSLHEYNLDYISQAVTENKRVDFLMLPDISSYYNLAFPNEYKKIVSVKNTIRERYSQVYTEGKNADKYLLTLDKDYLSCASAIDHSLIKMVLPKSVITKLPEQEKKRVLSIEQLMNDLVNNQASYQQYVH